MHAVDNITCQPMPINRTDRRRFPLAYPMPVGCARWIGNMQLIFWLHGIDVQINGREIMMWFMIGVQGPTTKYTRHRRSSLGGRRWSCRSKKFMSDHVRACHSVTVGPLHNTYAPSSLFPNFLDHSTFFSFLADRIDDLMCTPTHLSNQQAS